MKTVPRGIISAALLLLTSVVYAGHPAPGVQVSVKKGGASVFNTITDNTGQFTTGDLEPGEYQIELRGVRVVPPVRYFLVLSGARPVGQTMTNAGGDLAMQAQVRRITSIRGQVSANRIIVLPGANQPTNSTSAAGMPAGNARPLPTAAAGQRTTAAVAGTQVRSVGATATASPAMSAGRSAAAVSAAPNAPRPSATAASSARSAQTPLQSTPAVSASAAAAPATGSRIIGGKRYIWVPSAPGSKLGHWVPETPQPGVTNAAKPTGAAAQTASPAGR